MSVYTCYWSKHLVSQVEELSSQNALPMGYERSVFWTVQVRVCAVLSAMGGVAAIFTALAAGVYTVTITAQ